jgi:membrane protein
MSTNTSSGPRDGAGSQTERGTAPSPGNPSKDETSTAKASAPDPEDPSKPDSPTDITKPSWTYIAKKTLREFNRDQCTDLAAALTYWAVLAVAPAALAVVSMLGLFGDTEQLVNDVMEAAERVAPTSSLQSIQPIVDNLASKQGTGVGVLIGLLIALWSASGYVNAFSRAMNRMYQIDEGRPFWKLRPVMLLVTLILLALVALVIMAMVLSGPVAEAIGAAIGLSDVTVTVWNIAKWPVIVALVVVIIAVLYYATPNVRQPKIKWISVGSVVAIVVWALGTAAFGLYVSKAGNYDATYGTLAGVIIFLLWLWLTNNALLFGAELDGELERGRELQAGMKAEETLQLPPRDTRASEKKQKKLEEDIEGGRELRLSRGRRRGGAPPRRQPGLRHRRLGLARRL